MFTDEDLNMLIQILDFAVKSGGLAVAERAMPLAVKINDELVARQPVDDQEDKA
jgi:hypothetical protein